MAKVIQAMDRAAGRVQRRRPPARRVGGAALFQPDDDVINTKETVMALAGTAVATITAGQLDTCGAGIGAAGSSVPQEAQLQGVAEQVHAAGGETYGATLDVTRTEDLSRLVGLAADSFGRPDVLVSKDGEGASNSPQRP